MHARKSRRWAAWVAVAAAACLSLAVSAIAAADETQLPDTGVVREVISKPVTPREPATTDDFEWD